VTIVALSISTVSQLKLIRLLVAEEVVAKVAAEWFP
jgi:hypothetical protein